jgi:hypothetical protein
MVLILKGTEDIKRIKKILSIRQAKRGFDAKKFCGSLKVNEDALIIKCRLREEWN